MAESSRISTKHGFATMSFIAETFIFLYVGMDALDAEKWRFVAHSLGTSVGVSSILVGLVLVGRAASVFPLSFLVNFTKKNPGERIEFNQQVINWWAGLMRGSVSVALAYNRFAKSGHTQQRGNAIMITSTITVVFFSTLVFGLMTKPLLWLLAPESKYSSNTVPSDPSSPKSLALPLLHNRQDSEADMESSNIPCQRSICMLLAIPTRTVHFYWWKFDDACMRPVFGGRLVPDHTLGSTVEKSISQGE